MKEEIYETAQLLDFSGPKRAALTRINQKSNPNNPIVNGNPKKFFSTG